MRLVALMNLNSHVLLDAVIGPYCSNEIRLAHDLLKALPDNSIALFDTFFTVLTC